MRILFIEDFASSTAGGAERTTRKFSEHLATKHQVYLAFDRPGDYSSELNGIYDGICNVSTLPIGAQSFWSWMTSLSNLRTFCREHRIDLIVTHLFHAAPMIRLLKLLFPVEFVMHFKWIHSTPNPGRQVPWGLTAVDLGLANSEFVLNYWRRYCRRDISLQVVYNPVIEPEADRGVDRRFGNRLFHREPAILTIGFAGRIMREKGAHTLLHAIAALSDSGIACRCNIFGAFHPDAVDNPAAAYHRELRDLLTTLEIADRVRFVGYVDSVAPLMDDHDAFVVPSIRNEATTNVVLESMAAGIPVIAADTGGIPEVMTGAASDWLFAPDDVDSLTSALRRLDSLSDEQRREVGRCLQDIVKDRHSPMNVYKTMTDFIGIPM